MQAQRAPLSDGRWHFQHGPIDLVIGADGDADALAAAHTAAWQRFETVLTELVAELPLLRRPVRGPCPLQGVIARRMWWACHPFHSVYITPMAAVAGAVAQELIAAYAREGVRRAWINNGGDIALHLADGKSVNVGVVSDISQHGLQAPFGLSLSKPPSTSSGRTDARATGRPDPHDLDGSFTVDASMPVRGIATSGWRGRSFSLGIADSVTVLAATAAEADAAATVIANAVDVPDAGIHRRPASECKDDSDLGDIPVTVDVEPLAPAQVQRALEAGAARAMALQRSGSIWCAMLVCQGQWRLVEPLSSPASGIFALGNSPQAAAVGSVFA